MFLSACGSRREYSVSVDRSVQPRLRPRQVARIVQKVRIGRAAGKVEKIVSMSATRLGLVRHVVWIVHVRGKFHERAREVVYTFSVADLI
jgi:hypothetical protein